MQRNILAGPSASIFFAGTSAENATMKTQSAKSKGRRLQQQVAADIVKHFSALQEDDARSTSMGCGGEDVQLSPAARHCFPFSVECKNCEKLALWPALQQCAANAGASATPLLVFKRNHSPTYCVLRWEHLLRLLPDATAAALPSGRKRQREDDIMQAAYNDIRLRLRRAEAELAAGAAPVAGAAAAPPPPPAGCSA